MANPPNSARVALLNRACGLSDADIKTWTICIDPGYPSYVEHLLAVQRSNGRAGVDAVDWEPIFHAVNEDPTSSDTSARRRFRLFAAAIGILHPLCSELLAANQLAITLVELATTNPNWAPEVYAALDELRESLRFSYEDETPFASLACLLLASATDLNLDLSVLAARVSEDESLYTGRVRPKHAFLWSCTNFRNAFPRWKRCIEEHMPTSTPELSTLRASLLGKET